MMPSATRQARRYCLEDILTLQISYRKEPGRLRLWEQAKEIARFRRETHTSFLLRALAREVARCEAAMSISERIAYQDEIIDTWIASLTPEERKKYGL